MTDGACSEKPAPRKSFVIDRSKEVAVMGLWHLGSVYAASLSKLGFSVHGFDFDKKIIKNFQKGIPPIFEPELADTVKKYLNKNLFFSDSEKTIKNKKYIFITFDLEVDANDIVQTSVIKKTFSMLLKNSVEDSIIVISSQVPVGTSRILVNELKQRGVKNPKVILKNLSPSTPLSLTRTSIYLTCIDIHTKQKQRLQLIFLRARLSTFPATQTHSCFSARTIVIGGTRRVRERPF